jgi:serine/threonine-protein kinase
VRPSADRNLLFGILALQMDFISREALIAAMHAWVLDKARPLAQILQEQGSLSSADRAALEALVERHLCRHADDPERSLAAVASPALREDLLAVADPDLQATLSGLAWRRPEPEATCAYVPSPEPGSRYRILRPHARGGLGEVFVAEDRELHREVAIKEIHQEFADHPDSRSRFLLEAEVNGRLEHPGIVPVYSLGSHADGRPYYAMRFIQGDTLRDAIRRFHDAEGPGREPGERTLAVRQLLGQFVAVCQAVGYAHSRGVVHRDIKPTNILLGRFGETLLVDWGLAKVVGRADIDPTVGERTLRPASATDSATQTGAALGTPAYMSPEQASGQRERIGPASDIYSLGATLYNLLTGRQPIQGTTSAEIIDRAARGAWLPPGQVTKGVPRALEAICCRAMAALPEARYPTALELGADVDRWLADEPVSVFAEPWSTRARRWLNRHRILATATVATLLVAALSLAAATVLLKGARDRERQAREGEREARVRAEEHFGLARDAVDRYFTKVSESPDLKARGLESLRQDLLQQAREFYERFVQAQVDEPGLQAECGRAYLRLAEITAELGSPGEAIRLAGLGQAIFEQLLAAEPGNPAHQDNLAWALSIAGRNHYESRQLALSRVDYERSRSLREQLVRDHPGSAGYRFRLVVALNDVGQLYRVGLGLAREGEAAYEGALGRAEALTREYPDNPDYQSELARTLHQLAEAQDFSGKPERAKETFERALPILEKLVRDHPDVASYQDRLAETLHDLAVQYINTRQPAQGLSLCEKGLAVCERLVHNHPQVPGYKARLTRLHTVAAGALAQSGDHARAVVEVEAGVTAETDGLALYNGACAYTSASEAVRNDQGLPHAERDKLAERYQVRAIELLAGADRTGLFKAAALLEILENDHDLDPLRGRDDFKKLLAVVRQHARDK